MKQGLQFQNPNVNPSYKYHAPTYNPKGGMLAGHLISAYSQDGDLVGHIEWGHPMTPNGSAAVIGGGLHEKHRTQQTIDDLLTGLWDEAGKHAQRTGSSESLDRSQGSSQYVAPDLLPR